MWTIRSTALVGGAAMAVAISAHPLAAQEDGCADAECLVNAVAECRTTTFETAEPGGMDARGQYRVLGHEGPACRIEFTFLENPNPAWVEAPFTFLVDPSMASQEMIHGAVETCLLGGAEWYQCEGPLIELIAGLSEPEEGLVDGAGPLPCGQPVAQTGPALYPMPQNGRWGYVGRNGAWQIEPQWQRAKDFSEGRAAVGGPSGWGIIDDDGNTILPAQYQAASYVTINGQNWYDSPFSPFSDYSEGCAVMTHFTDMGQPSFFVDRQGQAYWRGADLPEALAQQDIRRFGVFSEGVAWFQDGFGDEARFGWVDAQGEIVIAPEFVAAGRFAEGLAFAAVRDGQGAYIDRDGQPVLPRKWMLHGGAPFSEGIAKVNTRAFDVSYWRRDDAVAFDTVDFGAAQGDRSASAGISDEAGNFRNGRAPLITGFLEGDDLVYVRSDGTVAFVPDELDGIAVCNRRALPEFRNGLVRLLVADDGETCGDEPFHAAMAQYETAHYVYLDTEGGVVMRQEK